MCSYTVHIMTLLQILLYILRTERGAGVTFKAIPLSSDATTAGNI